MLQTHFTAPKMRTPRCLVGASHAVLSHTGFAAFAEVAATSLVGYFTVHHGAYSTLPIAHGLCVPTHKPSVLRKDIGLKGPVAPKPEKLSPGRNAPGMAQIRALFDLPTTRSPTREGVADALKDPLGGGPEGDKGGCLPKGNQI